MTAAIDWHSPLRCPHCKQDAGHPFSGRSYHDVLGQALGLSEQMLARRLRGVLSQQG